MTNEEALEIIKEEYQYRSNLLAEYYEHYCKQDEYQYRRNLLAEYYEHYCKQDVEEENMLDALKIAIDAIEKQIQRKPWKQADDDTCLYYHLECVTCGRRLNERAKRTHCDCGQRIDWSDYE